MRSCFGSQGSRQNSNMVGKKNLVQSFHPWARPEPRRTQGRTVNPLPFSGVAKSLRTSAIPIPLRASPQGFPRRSPVGGWPWPKGSVARSADLAKLPQISGRAGIYSLWRIGPARRQWRHNHWQISCFVLGTENDINLKAGSHSGSNLLKRNIDWLKRLSRIVCIFAKFKRFQWCYICIWWRALKCKECVENMLELHLMSCYQKFNYVNGLNDFNDVTFAFDDVLLKRKKL